MTDQILALLIAERDKINKAIEALQGPTKRRGRPPKSFLTTLAVVSNEATPAPKKKARKVRQFSEEQRLAAAERMKQMWASKKLAPKTKAKKATKKTAE